jgi:hypothetical protein
MAYGGFPVGVLPTISEDAALSRFLISVLQT